MDEQEIDARVERVKNEMNDPFMQICARIELVKRELYEPKAVIFNTAFRDRIIDHECGIYPEDVKRLGGLKSVYGLSVFIKDDLADDEILIAYDPMHP